MDHRLVFVIAKVGEHSQIIGCELKAIDDLSICSECNEACMYKEKNFNFRIATLDDN